MCWQAVGKKITFIKYSENRYILHILRRSTILFFFSDEQMFPLSEGAAGLHGNLLPVNQLENYSAYEILYTSASSIAVKRSISLLQQICRGGLIYFLVFTVISYLTANTINELYIFECMAQPVGGKLVGVDMVERSGCKWWHASTSNSTERKILIVHTLMFIYSSDKDTSCGWKLQWKVDEQRFI